jgi:hypothetical protein
LKLLPSQREGFAIAFRCVIVALKDRPNYTNGTAETPPLDHEKIAAALGSEFIVIDDPVKEPLTEEGRAKMLDLYNQHVRDRRPITRPLTDEECKALGMRHAPLPDDDDVQPSVVVEG